MNLARSIKCLWSKVLCLLLFCSVTLAQQEGSLTGTLPSQKRFSTEIGYQIHSLPMNGSQMFGPALTYRLNERNSVGSRYLISPEDVEERRLSVFWRLSFGKRYFHWLIEPHFSYLWRKPQDGSFSTTGFSAGFRYLVSENLFLGALAGLEQSGPVFPVGPFWNRPSFILLTQFEF